MAGKSKTVYYLNGETKPKLDVQEDFELIKMHYDFEGKRVYSNAFQELIFWYWFEN